MKDNKIKVQVRRNHHSFNIAGCVGEVVRSEGSVDIVLIANNEWRVSRSSLKTLPAKL